MDHYSISKLLNDSTISKFVAKKLIKVNNLSSSQYSVNKNIRLKTSMLRSDLCDYSDTYIVVKGRISVLGTNASSRTHLLHLVYAFQKSVMHLQAMQKILILLCQCIIFQNIVTIILWH